MGPAYALDVFLAVLLPTLCLVSELAGHRRRDRWRCASCRPSFLSWLPLGLDAGCLTVWAMAALADWRNADWPVFAVDVYGVAVFAWLVWVSTGGGGRGRRVVARVAARVRAAGSRLAVVPVPVPVR